MGCVGYFHHAGSVDVEAAQAATWWPRDGKEALALWDAFTARANDLAAQARARRLAAKARGEAAASTEGQKLTAADRAVMHALLFDFANRRNGRCDPSQQRLAERTGLHRATISRALARLLRFGLLNWERRRTVMRRGAYWFMGQTSNLYRFVRGSMSQKPAETPNHIYSERTAQLSTAAGWTNRLLHAERRQQEADEARRRLNAKQRSLWADVH